MSTRHVLYEDHLYDCFGNGQLMIDYVECRLCKFVGTNISQHVKKVHGFDKDAYIKLYGDTLAENARRNYSRTNKQNGDWITRANSNGRDLTEYKQKMAAALSKSILANDNERKRRARMLGELNKTEGFRKKASETAKKTSSRPEILQKRTEQLKRWRSLHFDAFYEKCVMNMINCWHSRPEKQLFEIVSTLDGYEFKLNQTVKSNDFKSISKRKQIDIGDKHKRVYIEFDGLYHFKPIHGDEVLEQIKEKDHLLDEHMIKHGWSLVRVSYDQWEKTKFVDECLSQLFDFLKDPKPGVFRIGKVYLSSREKNAED